MFLFLLAKPIINIFFGSDYQLSIPVLKILAFTLIPYTINTYLLLMFLAKKKEKVIIWILTVSLVMLLILNLWLIPNAGQLGAGWSILIVEVAQAVLFLLAWLNSPFRKMDTIRAKGVSYELSDLS